MKSNQLIFAVLAVDILLFTIFENRLLVRLIKVDVNNPFYDKLALPGGLIKPKENAGEQH